MNKNKFIKYTSIILRIIVAIIFLLAGSGKFQTDNTMASNFSSWGLSIYMMFVVGLFEFVGGIFLLIPKTVIYGCYMLLIVMFGAIIIHILNFEELGFPFLNLALLAFLLIIIFSKNQKHTIMKIFKLFFLTIILCMSCINNNSQFDWLLGSWERTNGKPGSTTIENWSKIDNNNYKGISFVMVKNDTVYKEKVSIKKIEDTFYYIAEVPQNKNPTEFKIVSITENSFVSKNPNHDFPTEISYTREADILTAFVSNESKKIKYIFKNH